MILVRSVNTAECGSVGAVCVVSESASDVDESAASGDVAVVVWGV